MGFVTGGSFEGGFGGLGGGGRGRGELDASRSRGRRGRRDGMGWTDLEVSPSEGGEGSKFGILLEVEELVLVWNKRIPKLNQVGSRRAQREGKDSSSRREDQRSTESVHALLGACGRSLW